MRIFRYIAAGSLLLIGFLAAALPFVAPAHYFQKAIFTQDYHLYLTAVGSGLLLAAAARQIAFGTKRGLAWWVCLITALAGLRPSWLTPVYITPLIYLFVEAGLAGRRQRNGDAKSEQRSANSKSSLVEGILTGAVIFGLGILLSHLPAALRPVVPKNVNDGWLVMITYTIGALVIHEMGHALMGTALGFKLTSFAIYPLEFRRDSRGIRIAWNFRQIGGHYIGLPTATKNLWARHMTVAAAGPAINLATAFCTWLTLVCARGSIDGTEYGLLSGLMNWSLFLGLTNLVPLKSAGFKTDGRFLWEAFFDPVASRRNLAVLGCTSSRTTSLRPREWPEEWVDELRQSPSDLLSAALLSYSAQDRLLLSPNDPTALSDLAIGAGALEQVVTADPDPAVADAGRLHLAWLRCRYDGLVDGAADTMEPAHKDSSTEPFELLRLQAALQAAAGDTASAAALLDKAAKSLAATQKNGFDACDLEDLLTFRRLILAEHAPSVK